MSRPRKSLNKYNPALRDQAAVTLEDMGAQIVTQTWVAGTPGGLNTVLNSLRTSNVYGIFYGAKGQSYNAIMYEATDPTQSAFVFGLHNVGVSADNEVNRNIYGKLVLIQGAD